jgi:hypothetical protein
MKMNAKQGKLWSERFRRRIRLAGRCDCGKRCTGEHRKIAEMLADPLVWYTYEAGDDDETCGACDLATGGGQRANVRLTEQGPLCYHHWCTAPMCSAPGCALDGPYDGLCREHYLGAPDPEVEAEQREAIMSRRTGHVYPEGGERMELTHEDRRRIRRLYAEVKR